LPGINVLSDSLKVGSKLEKTATPKGEGVADNPENAASGFAMVLSGSMNQNVDPKGQNSKADRDSKEKETTEDSVQSAQNPNGSVSALGYGNFVFVNLFQPMLQSDLPAGKEANSGNDVSQGTVGVAAANASLSNVKVVAGNNLELAIPNLVSLAADEVSTLSGMTTREPQGDNPVITELDKYRQVISKLLEALSGEITDNSPKGASQGLVSSGTKDLSQDMARIVQGWMTATDEVAKGGQASGAQGTVPDSSIKGLNQLIALSGSILGISKGNTLSSESLGLENFGQDMAKIAQSGMTLTGDNVNNGSASTAQKGFQQLIDSLTSGFGNANPELNAKVATLLAELNPLLSQGANGTLQAEGMGNDLEPAVMVAKDTALFTHPQPKSAELGLQESKTLKNIQGIINEDIHKGDSGQASEAPVVKDVQNQNSSVGVGVLSNLVAANVADGKTTATPVWEQISTVIREQVMNRSQDLKQLDIQLHPADLGKIQIDLRWENGQVHLQVQASQAATAHLLQNHLSDLRQDLANQGINCGMLQMGQGGERQQNPHGDESRKTFNQNTSLNGDEDPIQVINPLSLGPDEINQINVTA